MLLRALIDAWPAGRGRIAFLDERARGSLVLPPQLLVHWVNPTVGSRVQAERKLRSLSRVGDTVFCFHGLPPVLPNAARVVVFQQNRNYLGMNSLRQFEARTALRLGLERWISRTFRHRVAQYIVQTPSMARDLASWYGVHPGAAPSELIRTLPFVDDFRAIPATSFPQTQSWDFVYVSDGVAHKNHRTLFAAWKLLADQGLKPRLALTLGARDQALIDELDALKRETHIEIHNLGHLAREQILALYRQAGALIFPSTSESFGLPLIEASQCGLPVLAPEADYVRDVCEPVQTFDPLSDISIMRAVRRFLCQPEPRIHLGRPADLWTELMAPPSPDLHDR